MPSGCSSTGLAMQQPAFELSSDNAAEVAEICRRLDGIPLAIELAAARVRTMALDDILARLEKRLRLLASGSTPGPAPPPDPARIDRLDL